MYCHACGEQIEDGLHFCPRCGTQQPNTSVVPAQPANKTSTDVCSVVGFVVSLISLLINFWGIMGIVATVFSVIGLLHCNQNHAKGKGLAIAGIVIGTISIVYGAFTLIVLAAVL